MTPCTEVVAKFVRVGLVKMITTGLTNANWKYPKVYAKLREIFDQTNLISNNFPNVK